LSYNNRAALGVNDTARTEAALRGKLVLIKLGFEYQEKSFGKLFSEISELHKVRNILAHSQFNHVRAFRGCRAGVEFSYMNKFGEMPMLNPELLERQINDHKKKQKAHKKRKGKQEKSAVNKVHTVIREKWKSPDEQTITYAQFDKYDAQAKKLMMALVNIAVEPINDGIPFVQDVSKIISSSDNVLLFPK
jgi:hypothetical protein